MIYMYNFLYNFFERWKTVKADAFLVEKDLLLMEKIYKIKVMLFKIIWQNLLDEKINFQKVEILLNLYEKYGKYGYYDSVIEKCNKIPPEIFLNISKKEFESFYELIYILKEKSEREYEFAVPLLKNLKNGIIPNNLKSDFYEIQNLLKYQSDFIIIEDKRFKEIASFFLLKKEPGSKYKGYVPIIQAFRNGKIVFEKDKFYLNGKQIQGLRSEGNFIYLKGDHFTTIDRAESIVSSGIMIPSDNDPFGYFVEKGKFNGYDKDAIKKILGASSADASISLEIRVFPEQVFVKIENNKPIKFAISNLTSDNVINVSSEIRKTA